jgi:NADPH-dependent curcumin reductase CurA
VSTPLPRPTTTEIVLTRSRTGHSVAPSSCLSTRQIASPALAAGEVRVRNDFMQVTAVMADLMTKQPGLPMPAYELQTPLWGGATGTVVESAADLPVGTVVTHMSGWRDETVAAADTFWPVPVEILPGAEYVLNQGVTAYHGIVDVAQVKPGDVVFVSGAAGGVGSLAGQIAKATGAALVIGSAGSDAKVAYLVDELGFDAAINYHSSGFLDQLRALAPDGIDVFFDTVGGDQFEAAVQVAAPGARFALCGALAGQIDGGQGGSPRLDIMTAIVKQLEIRPFSTHHTPEQIQAWNEHYGLWLSEGRIVFPHTIVDGGLAAAPDALDNLLRGAYRGNVIVRLNHS